jgi:hypothetical protein
MRLHALYLPGALLATGIRLSAGAVPLQRITRQASALGKPRRLRILALPVIIGSRTPMPRTASSGRRIARPAGE